LQNVSKCPIKKPQLPPPPKDEGKTKKRKKWIHVGLHAFGPKAIIPYTYFKAIFAVLFTFLVAIQFHFHKES